MKERKVAGSHYIVNFYNEIQQLNQHYSLYRNLMIEVRAKHGEDPKPESLGDEEKATVTSYAQAVRHFAHKIIIQYKSIIKATKLKEDKAVNETYQKILKDFIIKVEDLEKFVVSINMALVNEVIQDLLISSQDLVQDIYQNEPKNTADSS